MKKTVCPGDTLGISGRGWPKTYTANYIDDVLMWVEDSTGKPYDINHFGGGYVEYKGICPNCGKNLDVCASYKKHSKWSRFKKWCFEMVRL